MAVSPDGRDLVFAAFIQEQPRLFLRPLKSDTGQALPGTEGGLMPFWSPDGHSVGFFAQGSLKRVDRNGPVQTLARASSARGGTWGTDGSILFAPLTAGPLYRVPADGGVPTPATRLLENQQSHRFPRYLSDGRHFLYFAQAAAVDRRGVYMGAMGSSDAVRLMDSDVAAVATDDDTLLFVRQGNLVAQRLDVAAGKLLGTAVVLADEVAIDGTYNVAGLSAGAGLIAFRTGRGFGLRDLLWYDRAGTPTGRVGDADSGYPRTPELSPDGRRVATSRSVGNNTDIWLIDVASGLRTKLTFDPSADVFPVWSPDSAQLAFASNRKGLYGIYVKAANGGGSEELLSPTSRSCIPLDWSQDGRYIVYRATTPEGFDLWALPLSGSRTPVPVATTPYDEREAQVSPDSRWVAYQSNETGRFEVYVQAFPVAGSKWQISVNGGVQPRWSAISRELFYMGFDGRLNAVPLNVTRDDAIQLGTAVPLFTPRIASGPFPGSDKQQYAVSRDGRFLVLARDDASTAPITILLNWKAVK